MKEIEPFNLRLFEVNVKNVGNSSALNVTFRKLSTRSTRTGFTPDYSEMDTLEPDTKNGSELPKGREMVISMFDEKLRPN